MIGDEILSFLPAYLVNQQSCLQEYAVRHMLYETYEHIYNNYMLIIVHCSLYKIV